MGKSADTARALKAASSTTIKIAGKECQVKPLGLRALTEAQRDCVERYKRSYLKTWSDNLDLVPNGESILLQKIEECARWDVDDLPPKRAVDENTIKVTKKLRAWVDAKFGQKKDDKGNILRRADQEIRRIVGSALDQESLSVDDYKALTGTKPFRMKIPYVNWWITGDFEGMVTMCWLCFRDSGVSRKEVEEALTDDPALLSILSREIESLSAPSGNG